MDDRNSIFAALTSGDTESVKRLLSAAPALAGARREDGLSLLMLACYHRQQDVIEAIRATGVALDLHEAAATGDIEAMTAILEQDPTAIGSFSCDGWTPLHLAAYFGRGGAVRELLGRGASVRARSRKPLENMPLNAAAAGNDVEVSRLLLDAGADPNARQSGGYVPLHAAAQNGNRALVQLLLERGAERGLKTDDGRTSLDLAREAGHEGILES